MELRAYYAKIRQAEEAISDEWVVVISSETTDGGVQGCPAEVSRRIAAQLIVDGKARLAERSEIEKFRADAEEARKAAERASAASKVQVVIVPPDEDRPPVRPTGKTR